VHASLGCGNPLAVADLRPGERVLDPGSGGGIDVLLSARRVGPSGFAFGLDMTDEMLELARAGDARGDRPRSQADSCPGRCHRRSVEPMSVFRTVKAMFDHTCLYQY